MADDQEYLKLPIDEQCVHKVWKARLHGYEEAAKLFKKISDEKSSEFSKYAGLVKKFVIDSNAVAQEKGLDAVLAFLDCAHIAPKTVGEVTAGVVAKCLNSSRTKTKEKGMEILMIYIELEKQEQVMEELLKGLTNKQPKIVAACLEVMASAVREFGSKVITLKPIVKSVPKVLEHSDKNVREKAKQLAIDLYRWIGAAMKPSLQNIKPVQLKELEEEFEKLPGKPAKQTRFLKSQQDLKAKAMAQDDEEEEEEEEVAGAVGPAIDPYDLLEPVDILAKLPKDFYENMEAKKWQIRKEALEVLQPLTANPKIEPGDFAELVRVLKKTIAKDTNVMIVAIAGKCMAGIALGIRKKFAPYAVACISSILDKFKEKKVNVVAALREAIDAIFPSTTFQNIQEEVLAALDNKNPSIRTETALFLGRAFRQCTPTTLPKAVLKPLCTSLVKKLADTTPDCRDAASEALGTALKVVGEKPMNPLIADLEKIKLDKIKEYSEKVELVHGGGKKKPKEPKAVPGPSKEAPAAKAPTKAPVKAKSGSKPGTAKAKAKAGSSAAGGGKAVKGGKKKSSKNESQEEMKSEPLLTDEEVDDKAAALLSASILTQLASSNWKERLAAMEEFTKKVENMEKNNINAQVFVRVLAKKPGFKEANFQVMNAKIALVGFVAEKARFSRRCAQVVIASLIDKVGDIKSGSKVKEALTAIAEACQLGYVAEETITYAFEKQKNPKNQAELLNWFAQAIQEFGFSTVTPKKVIGFIKTALAAVNPQVRTAAITLLGVMYMYMGATLRMLFDGEKAALLAQIDAEIEKVSGQTPPAPFRGIVSKKGGGGDDDGGDEDDEEEEDDEDGGGGGGMNVADLVPRTDISSQITAGLVAEMGDSKWKIRGEALEKVTGILKEAKFITPSLGDLPTALKGRLGDSNKNLAQTTANILATIATALGPASKQHVKTFAAGLLLLCGDSKPSVRAAATASLTAWEEQTGLAPFLEDEILLSVLAKEKPVLRAEIFGWLETRMGKYRSLPSDLSQCVPFLFAGLEDRNADVRKNATAVLPLFMMHLSYEKMVKMTGKLKPSSKDQVVGIMEKQRPNIPAKPGKPEKAGKATKKETSRPSSAAPSEEPEAKKESAPTKRPKTAPAKPVQNDTGSNSSLSSSTSAPPTSEGSSSKGKQGKGAAAAASKGKAGKAASSSKKKKDEDEDTGPAVIQNNGKDRRLKDESDLKVLKWNFTTPRAEYIDQLKDQITPCVSKTVFGLLFHSDFKKHITAVGILTEYVGSNGNAIKSNLDVLLKWVSLRFFDTNTSVLVKVLEFLRSAFTMLSSIDYNLLDQEANSFIPYLILKIGDPKENVRKDVKAVIKLLTKVYPASKMFGFLMEGIKSKNARQRTECLDELGILIELYGLNVCQPSPPKALKEVASQLADRDNNVRSAALNTLVQVYSIVGEDVYKYVGNLNEKEMSLLEERIKRSGKKPAPAKTAPAPSQKNAEEKNAQRPDAKKSNLPNPGKTQRPATAPPRPPGNQSSAPKVFSLDLDKLGLNDDEGDLKPPELEDTEVNDLLEKPVVLPKRKVQKSAVPTMMQLNFMISQIASNDIAISIQALAQLDEILKDSENTKAVIEHVDQLLVATSLQLRMAFSKHMGDEITSKDVIRMYRCLAALLVSVFQNTSLSQRASKDVLCDLINGLITVLIDDRLMSFDDGPQVVRSFNIVMAKVVENSNHNAAIGALIKLLQECVARESGSTKFASLIMKCLWRLVRTMPNIINELNVDRILLDLHLFLKAFPSSVWRDQPSDTPLRTVKTILHSLAKILGQKVLNHLTLIPDTKDSEVESYLKKVLRSSSVSSSSSNDHINGSAPDVVRLHSDKNVKQSPRRAPARTNDLLALIFQKIGSNENTREGLAELYDFKQKYPEVDIDPFLKKTSHYFQTYITHGLQNIAKERGEKNFHTTNVMVRDNQQENNPEQITPSNPRPDGDGTDSEPISDVLGRIKVLRARCGLENAQEGTVDNIPKTGPPPKQEIPAPASELSNKDPLRGGSHHFVPERISLGSSSSNLPATAPQLAPLPDVDDLKKRLEKIKNSCK